MKLLDVLDHIYCIVRCNLDRWVSHVAILNTVRPFASSRLVVEEDVGVGVLASRLLIEGWVSDIDYWFLRYRLRKILPAS